MKCEEFYITKIGSILHTLAKKVRGNTVPERKNVRVSLRVLKETLIKISGKKKSRLSSFVHCQIFTEMHIDFY